MSIRDDLKAYLDGELSEQRAAEVRAALESDPSLRAEAERLRAISNTLRLAAVDYAPVGLEKTLRALEKGPAKPQMSRWTLGGWLIAGAAATLVLVWLFFPVYAQPKEAAMRTAMRVKEHEISAVAASPSGAPLAPAEPPREADTVGGEPAAKTPAIPGRPGTEFKATRTPKTAAQMGDVREQATRASSLQPDHPVETGIAKRPAQEAAKDEVQGAVVQDSAGAGGGGSGGIGYAPAAANATPPPFANALSVMARKAVGPRLIVNNGDVAVYVKDVKSAKGQTESFARASGGFIQSSDLQGEKPENQTANLVLRVPVESYAKVLQQIKGLGQVNRDSSTGTDVTAQSVDAEARLKTMRAEEAQYRDIMKQARKIDDVLQVKEKLSEVRQEIESLDAQAKSLRDQAALSTIAVSFSVKPKEPLPQVGGTTESWLGRTLSSALGSFQEVAKALATLLIFLLVFMPIWGPVMALSFWVYKVSRPQYRY